VLFLNIDAVIINVNMFVCHIIHQIDCRNYFNGLIIKLQELVGNCQVVQTNNNLAVSISSGQDTK